MKKLSNTKFINKITFIGAGHVATHLALELHKKGNKIVQVYSRTEKSAKTLAKKVNAKAIHNISKIDTNADIYIIAISDDAIISLIKNLHLKDKLVVHTSGSMPMSLLKKVSSNYGVFYPLQTFNKHVKINFSEIPILIEANNKQNITLLKNLASSISLNTQCVDSDKRLIIHLAAIVASNFSNFMYVIAEDILKRNKISIDVLKPLIHETAQKINYDFPHKLQTGPAVRKDFEIIKKHLNLLAKDPDYKKIYKLISNNIIKHIKKHEQS